jgi:hypothetical protein
MPLLRSAIYPFAVNGTAAVEFPIRLRMSKGFKFSILNIIPAHSNKPTVGLEYAAKLLFGLANKSVSQSSAEDIFELTD